MESETVIPQWGAPVQGSWSYLCKKAESAGLASAEPNQTPAHTNTQKAALVEYVVLTKSSQNEENSKSLVS